MKDIDTAVDAEFTEVKPEKVDLRRLVNDSMVEINAELLDTFNKNKPIPKYFVESQLLLKMFNRGYVFRALEVKGAKLPELGIK